MMKVSGGIREARIAAVVTRADGRVEDLGVISYYHKSAFRRLLWRLKRWLHS
jgi:hypothetical protein